MGALITPDDISALARPCYADEEIASKAIDEAIDIDLRYLVGDDVYKQLIDSKDFVLLNGGEYTDRKGDTHIIAGLKKAVAYFSYSRIVKFGNSLPTRFGTMQNDDGYSSRAELKERQMVSDDAYNIGLKYTKEVLTYLQKDDCKPIDPLKSRRSTFKVIGD